MTRAAAKAAAAADVDVHLDESPDAPRKEPLWNDETSQTPIDASAERSVLDSIDTNIEIERANTQEHGKMAGSEVAEINAQYDDTEAPNEDSDPSDAKQRLESLFAAQIPNAENEEATISVIQSRRGSTTPEVTMQQMDDVKEVDGAIKDKMDDEFVAMGGSGLQTGVQTIDMEEGIRDDKRAALTQEQTVDHQELTAARHTTNVAVDAEDVAFADGSALNNASIPLPEPAQDTAINMDLKQERVSKAQTPAHTQQVRSRSTISALHTPPRATKSNKPVTKSTFQLPGEAIAAKLRAQREERLLRMEEEEKKRREFKARPVSKPIKPFEPKATLTSRVRMSLLHERTQEDSKPDAIADRSKPLSRPSLPATKHAAPGRLSFAANIGKARPASSTNSPLATSTNSQTPRAGSTTTTRSRLTVDKQITTRPAIEKARKSVSSVSVPTEKKGDGEGVMHPPKKTVRATGAEVFRRPMLQKAEEEKALREKIDAQKKARMEAAERSKNMARAFAEKKKSASQASSRNVSGPMSTDSPVATIDVATASATAMKWAQRLSTGRDSVAGL